MTHERLINGAPSLGPGMKIPGPNDFIGYLNTQHQEHGDTFDIDLGDRRAVVTAHPNGIQRILNHPNYARKAPLIYRGVERTLGKSILTASGIERQKSREVMKPSFHPKQIQDMTPMIATIGSNFTQELRERYVDGQNFNVFTEMNTLARRTLAGVLFGKHADALMDLDETMTAAFELVDVARKELDEATQQQFDSITLDLWGGTQAIIDTARKTEPDASLPSRLAHSNLDDETKRAEFLTIIFAGQETTALALTWLFDTMQGRPYIAEGIRDEIQTVLGDRQPEHHDIANLPYINRVIAEVLRLRPPVSAVARIAEEADILDGVDVNAGDMAIANIHQVQRHPKLHINPDYFTTDRRIPKPAEYSYLPFALGDRMCIGRGLALSELALHTVSLFRDPHLQVVSEPATPEFHTILTPATPVEATFNPLANVG